MDAATGRPTVPNGSLGYRWSPSGEGHWNLDLGDIDPQLSLLASDSEAVEVLLPRFDGPQADVLRKTALARNDYRSLRAALDRGPDKLPLIAEIKTASPSAGAIADSVDPVAIAKTYRRSGADSIPG